MRPECVIQRTARAYLLRDVRSGGFERGVFRLRLEDAQKLRDGDARVEQRAELFAEQDDLFAGDRLLEEPFEALALQRAVLTGNPSRHEAAAKQRLARLFRAFGLNIAGERHAFVIDRPVGVRMFQIRHECPLHKRGRGEGPLLEKGPFSPPPNPLPSSP